MSIRIRYIFILSFLLFGCKEKELLFNQPAKSYFPLKAGSVWKYRWMGDTSMAMMLYCSNYIEINDTVYAVLEERRYNRSQPVDFIRHFLRYDSSGSVYRFVNEKERRIWHHSLYGDQLIIIPADQKDYCLYNFNAELKKEYFIEKYPHPFGSTKDHRLSKVDVTLISRNDTVITPLGTFYNCYKYYLDQRFSIDEECIDLLAPNIGLVMRYNTQGPSGMQLCLYSFIIQQ